jgi:hypothetical protein
LVDKTLAKLRRDTLPTARQQYKVHHAGAAQSVVQEVRALMAAVRHWPRRRACYEQDLHRRSSGSVGVTNSKMVEDPKPSLDIGALPLIEGKLGLRFPPRLDFREPRAYWW